MNLQVNDYVFIEPTAVEDCTIQAWDYIKTAPYGKIVFIMDQATHLPASERLCFVEFQDEFAGGLSGQGCQPRRGQYVTAKHLSLDFEASREAITVPVVGAV